MRFTDILEGAQEEAARGEDYEVVALIARDGIDLDKTWQKAPENVKSRYRGYIDTSHMRCLQREQILESHE